MKKITRLLDMMALLEGRRSRPVRELAAHFETTERTIFRDLADLEELGFPLTSDEHGYRIMDGATMRPLHLDAGERALLRLLVENPSVRRPPALARRLEIVAAKLDRIAPPSGPSKLVLAGIDRSGPIQSGVIEAIEGAIDRSEAIEIDYASLRSAARSRRMVDPWAIFHRSEAWYFVGRCHRHDEARMFRLDRIAAVRASGARFERPADFDLESFLGGAWSLYHGHGGEPREIVIRFDASLAPLIANARHHEGERVERLADGDLEYRVELRNLDEIARWIASFGGHAIATAPPELIAKVRELGEGILREHAAPLKLAAKTRKLSRVR
ncbi:MAG: helix-turn-helix transcriptional regulator [Thermoanaerobaculia bacterium]